jgi:spore coat-associated protein N
MKRMKVLIGKRRVMVIATLAILVLAAAALVASSASFTAKTVNAGNLFTAGKLDMTNDKAPNAINVDLSNMRPGDSTNGTVTLSNVGTVPGHFYLTKTVVQDADGLGNVLHLKITDTSQTPATTVYDGALSGALDNTHFGDLGVWQNSGATATHTYSFTVSWSNNHPADGGSDAADTNVMGKNCKYSFSWDAVANSTIN